MLDKRTQWSVNSRAHVDNHSHLYFTKLLTVWPTINITFMFSFHCIVAFIFIRVAL